MPSPLLRRRDIFQLADHYREQTAHNSFDEIASKFDINLTRSTFPHEHPDGVALVDTISKPIAVRSVVSDYNVIPLWNASTTKELRVILMNDRSSLPEPEIFWHEFYHIMHSPRENGGLRVVFNAAQHNYRVEERRADDFAVAMLIPQRNRITSLSEIMEEFGLSSRLATHAINLFGALGITGNAT